MNNQTVETERKREAEMFALFQFLMKRPDLAANEDKGGKEELLNQTCFKGANRYKPGSGRPGVRLKLVL